MYKKRQRLAILRKQNGLTQSELAEIIGVSQSTLTDYERDKLRLNDNIIIKISGALKISSDTLLGIKTILGNHDSVSLKIMKRLKRIENLPDNQQKAILRNLDISLTGIEKELQ